MPREITLPEVLAEIQWFSCTIEKIAIEVYFGNHSVYAELHTVLSNALEELRELKTNPVYKAIETDCPWPICDNGECKPCCGSDAPEEDNIH